MAFSNDKLALIADIESLPPFDENHPGSERAWRAWEKILEGGLTQIQMMHLRTFVEACCMKDDDAE